MTTTTIPRDEVRAALLRDNSSGKYVWAAVHIDSCGACEIIDIAPDLDAAKSAAWAFAQRTGATFVPTRRGVRP